MNSPTTTGHRPIPRDWLIAFAHLAPAIAWAVVIFVFSAQTTPSAGPVAIREDKWSLLSEFLHFAEFALLAGLLLVGIRVLAWRRLKKRISQAGERAILAATALLSIAYAASDEWHQSFVSGRTASVIDFLIDSAGVVAAVAIAAAVIAFLRRRGLA